MATVHSRRGRMRGPQVFCLCPTLDGRGGLFPPILQELACLARLSVLLQWTMQPVRCFSPGAVPAALLQLHRLPPVPREQRHANVRQTGSPAMPTFAHFRHMHYWDGSLLRVAGTFIGEIDDIDDIRSVPGRDRLGYAGDVRGGRARAATAGKERYARLACWGKLRYVRLADHCSLRESTT